MDTTSVEQSKDTAPEKHSNETTAAQRLLLTALTTFLELQYILYRVSRFAHLTFWTVARLFGAKAPQPEAQWGHLTSLYSSLSGRQVYWLEQMIHSRYEARYGSARFVFQYLLPPVNSNPLLALERATLHEMEGFDGLSATCLQEAIESNSELGPGIASPVFRLLQIRLAEAELSAYGKLPQALAAARKLRPWLESQAPENYTDVTTRCYLCYQGIIKIAKLHSNWLDSSIDGNLPPTAERSYAASTTALRRSLQAMGHFDLAQRLVKQESNMYNDNDPRALAPFEEILECEWAKSESLAVVHAVSFIRVFYAQCLCDQGAKDQAAKQLTFVEDAYSQHLARSNPRLQLLLEVTRARLTMGDDPVADIQRHVSLAEQAAALGDRPIQRPELIFAFRKADALNDRTPVNVSLLMTRELMDRTLISLMEFEAEQTGSAFWMCMSLSTRGLFAASNGDAADWLELFEAFQESFPGFEVPLKSHALLSHAHSAYLVLGNETAAAKVKDLKIHCLANCPYVQVLSDGRLQPLIDGPDDEYFREWGKDFWPELKDWDLYTRYQFVSATILLRWVKREVAEQLIDATLGAQILKWVPVGDDASFDRWLATASASSIQAAIYGPPKVPTKSDEWDVWYAVVSPWLMRSDLPPSVLHRHNLLKEICNCRHATLTRWHGPFPIPIDWLQLKLRTSRHYLDTMQSLDPRVVRDNEVRTCKGNVTSTIIEMSLNPQAREEKLVQDKDLAEAQATLEEVAREFRDRNEWRYLLFKLGSLWRLTWIRTNYFKTLPALACIPYIEEADIVVQRIISQFENLPGEQGFAARLAAADELGFLDMYRSGIRASYYAVQQWVEQNLDWIKAHQAAQLPAEARSLADRLLEWSQKAKARTTTSILGFSLNVPRGSAMSSVTARSLIDREDKLVGEFNEASRVTQRLRIRADLRLLRQEMLADDALRPLIELQTGASLSVNELLRMSSWFQEDIVFVDLVQVALWDAWDLALVVFRNGEFIHIQPLPITTQVVESWISSNLELDRRIHDEDDDASFFPLRKDSSTQELAKLSALVSPLANCTRPGELLVFCPIGSLSRVPLHALPMGDTTCIERNPVVYCQSFNLLRLCIINRSDFGGVDALGAVVYNPLQNEVFTATAVSELAKSLETSVAERDPSKTPKEDFLSKIEKANIVHFHGHVRFDDSDPLAHHLELAPVRADDEGDAIPLESDEILTARDVLGVRIRPGCHITTISCKSARVRVTEANDLVGLGTAFHCAGAGSVVSTLWNIWRQDGVKLSQAFYGHLFEQGRRRDADGALPTNVDMARAMQHAILRLRKDEDGIVRAPYHWAGFVLNGAWEIQNPVPEASA